MSFHTGSDGQLWFAEQGAIPDADGTLPGQTLIAKVRSWSFTSTTATLDVTALGDTDKTFREGIRTASGNASIFYYTKSPNEGNASQLINKQLGDRDDPNVGTNSEDEPGKFSLKFLIGRGSQNPYYIICRVSITSMSLTMSVGDVCSADIAFDVNGAPVQFRL